MIKTIQEVNIERGYSLGGKHYKRVPRGYDPKYENVELLLYKGLTAGIEEPIPEQISSSALLDYCYQKYTEMDPIQHWLFEMTEALSSG